MSQLGVGLIGCGTMGLALGEQLIQIPAARLVGVTDPNKEAAEAAAEQLGTRACADLDALLADPALDAVLVAAPPFLHRRIAEQAAAAGRHLFVEKPLAPTVADCDAIADAAESAGVTLMVGQVLRFYPTWRCVLDRVARGDIGRPIGATITRISPGWGSAVRDWRHSLELSGGILMEINAHEIDFMCQLCGDPVRVYATGGRYGSDPADYPNYLFVSVTFGDGAVGLLHTSNVSTMSELSGKIQGTEGAIFYQNAFQPDGEIRIAWAGAEPEVVRVGSLEMEQPVRHELRLFVESVLGGGPSPIPARAGRRNVAIAAAAYESVRTGQAVLL